jgi:hypothetical protein
MKSIRGRFLQRRRPPTKTHSWGRSINFDAVAKRFRRGH